MPRRHFGDLRERTYLVTTEKAHPAPGWILASLLAVGAVASGFWGAKDPRLFVIIVGAITVMALAAFANAKPRAALAVAVVLVLIAGTKFRYRDVADSNIVDAQVLFELALYAINGVILAVAWQSERRERVRLTAMDLMLWGYVLYTLASVSWSNAPKVSLVRSLELMILLLLIGVIVRLWGIERALRMIGAPLLPFALVSAAAALTLPGASGTIIEYEGDVRFSWFAMHPISVAAVVGTAFIYLLADALFLSGGWSRRRFAIPLWLHGVVLLAIFLATRSRGPTLALLLAVSALVLRRYARAWTIPLLGAIVTATVLVISAGPSLGGLMRSGASSSNPLAAFLFRWQSAQEVESLNGRADLWEGSLSLLRRQPLIGYGYQGSRQLLLDIMPWAGHAHNALMEALLDLGILGASLIWLPVGLCFFRSLTAPRNQHGDRAWCQAVILGVVTFMIVNSMGDASFAGTPTFDVFLMMGCILIQERLRLSHAAT